jgi:signal transduction histidine kinase
MYRHNNFTGDDVMEFIYDMLRDFQPIVILSLVIVVIILLFLQILNKIEINRMEKRYKKLMKGSTGKNIEEMIMEYSDKIDDSLEVVKKMENTYNDIDYRLRKCIQKYSIVRYRAFDDVGSDLSFSIALLDDKNNGVVVTGIYGRNECTTFAKPVENGISKYDLSDEEKQAIKNALESR